MNNERVYFDKKDSRGLLIEQTNLLLEYTQEVLSTSCMLLNNNLFFQVGKTHLSV